MTDFPSPAEMLPHRGESLLLDRIVDHDADSTTARVEVGASRCLARNDGSVPAWLAIEFMAQCVGAHEFMTRDDLEPKEGYLVSVAKLRLSCEKFLPGERLRVRARRLRASAGIGIVSYLGEVDSEPDRGEPTRLAEARINILIPPH